MGIRINCPKCQKQLNVKTFLAGKRGVCPDCGTKFDIPAGGEHNVILEVEESESTVSARKTEMIREQQLLAPPGMPLAQPVFPAAVPTAAPAAMPMAAPMAQPVQPYAMPAVPAAYGHGHPHVMPVGVAPAMNPVQPMMAQPMVAQPMMAQAAVAVPARPDPIAQAPQTPWHICSPSGDQYGPVLGDVLRQWVADGRITPEALLWREGWPDWQRADAVLLEFAPAPAMQAMPVGVPATFAEPGMFPAAAPATESLFPTEPARMSTGRPYVRKSKNMQTLVITLLILALLILGPLLGYVLVRQL